MNCVGRTLSPSLKTGHPCFEFSSGELLRTSLGETASSDTTPSPPDGFLAGTWNQTQIIGSERNSQNYIQLHLNLIAFLIQYLLNAVSLGGKS